MVLSTSVGALAQLGARHTGSVEVTGSNPVCSIEESTWNRDFLYILIMKLANGLGHSHLLFMGRCIDLRSGEAAPLIIWHGELQHGWEIYNHTPQSP